MLTDDFIPLINVICSGEEDTAPDHLSHDAAHRPNVHVLLVAHPQDDFGGAVVPRHDVRSHHEGGACRPRQSKVEDLQRAVGSHDDVRGFQVSVDFRECLSFLISLHMSCVLGVILHIT